MMAVEENTQQQKSDDSGPSNVAERAGTEKEKPADAGDSAEKAGTEKQKPADAGNSGPSDNAEISGTEKEKPADTGDVGAPSDTAEKTITEQEKTADVGDPAEKAGTEKEKPADAGDSEEKAATDKENADDAGDSGGPSGAVERAEIEKAIQAHVDNIIRDLVKLKLMSRPNAKCPKDEKAKLLVDACLQENNAEFVEKVCEIMGKYGMAQTVQQLQALTRPPKEEEKQDVQPAEEQVTTEEEPAADADLKTGEQDLADTGPKPKDYREVLDGSHGTFMDTLLVTKALLDLLEEGSVINQDMRAKILCSSCRGEKVRVFLHFMMGLGPESLEQLIQALRATKQDFLANILAASPFV